MFTIKQLLKSVCLSHSPSEQLDLEWLLSAALNKPRSYLYTWPDYVVSDEVVGCFKQWVGRRQKGEPIAYILGKKGFWTFDLAVNHQTLIPRPDTELLVETCLKQLPASGGLSVLDLGTGTGAVGLAIASERPNVKVIGVDYLADIISLAEHNRQQLALENICFRQSHWFTDVEGSFDVVVSNPPYIASADPHLLQGDVKYEPLSALVSGEDGLDDIRLIIHQAPDYLKKGGWLFLEHGYQQANEVGDLLKKKGFVSVNTAIDLGGNERVTGGQWVCL